MSTDNQGLVHVDQGLTPVEFTQMVEAAHEKAKILADIVEKAHLYTDINKKKYLNVEAWQTIGRAYGYTAKAGDVQVVRGPDGQELGVMARSVIYDSNGVIVGGAEGYCMNDEPTWASRAFYARAGMAQTRSISRGFRQLVSWVVVLAGYAPTPAEEISGDDKPLPAQAAENQYGVCPTHNAPYFQRGKMTKPGHTLPDGKTWCNKADAPKVAQIVPPDPLDPLSHDQKKALFDLGYTTAEGILKALGADSLTTWLKADQTRTTAAAMKVLRDAKADAPTKA